MPLVHTYVDISHFSPCCPPFADGHAFGVSEPRPAQRSLLPQTSERGDTYEPVENGALNSRAESRDDESRCIEHGILDFSSRRILSDAQSSIKPGPKILQKFFPVAVWRLTSSGSGTTGEGDQRRCDE